MIVWRAVVLTVVWVALTVAPVPLGTYANMEFELAIVGAAAGLAGLWLLLG